MQEEKQWYEPMHFEIRIIEVKSACRANHRVGETFQAEYRTPDKPFCGEAYVGMYPILYAMRIGGDMQLMGKEQSLETVYSCPSRVVRFLIRGIPRCNRCGKEVNNWDNLIRYKTKYLETICQECFEKI